MANQAPTTDVQRRVKKLTAYIGKVSRNLIIDDERKNRGIEIHSLDDPMSGEDANGDRRTLKDRIPADGPSVENIVMGDEIEDANQAQHRARVELIQQVLPELTLLQQYVVNQHVYEVLTFREIAELLQQQCKLRQELGLTAEPKEENIKKTYHQAIKRIKQKLQEGGGLP